MWLQLITYSRETGVRRFSIWAAKVPELCDFEGGMIVGAVRGGSSVTETATILTFSHTAVSRVYREMVRWTKHIQSWAFLWQKHLSYEKDQRRIARLVRAGREATKLTAQYHSGEQKGFCEYAQLTPPEAVLEENVGPTQYV